VKLVNASEELVNRKLCPECKRIAQASALVGLPPVFPHPTIEGD